MVEGDATSIWGRRSRTSGHPKFTGKRSNLGRPCNGVTSPASTFRRGFSKPEHCKSILNYVRLSTIIFSISVLDCRVPDSKDVSFGELKQGKKCLDTLGSQAGGSIGLFDCHGQAGNQVLRYQMVRQTQTRVVKWCTVSLASKDIPEENEIAKRFLPKRFPYF